MDSNYKRNVRFFGWHLDFLGFSASFLCAIHCLALPVVLAAGIAGGSVWMHQPMVEWGLVGLAMLLAGWSLGRTYLKRRQLLPLLIGLLGIAVLVVSRLSPGPAEHYLSGMGGVGIALAHYLNWRVIIHQASR